MVRKQPTGRPELMLAFLRDYTLQHGYPPTLREIGHAIEVAGLGAPESGKISTSVISYNLDTLERRGLIRRDRNVTRGTVVLK